MTTIINIQTTHWVSNDFEPKKRVLNKCLCVERKSKYAEHFCQQQKTGDLTKIRGENNALL